MWRCRLHCTVPLLALVSPQHLQITSEASDLTALLNLSVGKFAICMPPAILRVEKNGRHGQLSSGILLVCPSKKSLSYLKVPVQLCVLAQCGMQMILPDKILSRCAESYSCPSIILSASSLEAKGKQSVHDSSGFKLRSMPTNLEGVLPVCSRV